MPMKREKYPRNWGEIAFTIKSDAGWKCEACGKKCYNPGERVKDSSKVLTVAHINHVESDCRPENLLAACAVCHLQYDNIRRRWERLARRRISANKRLELFQ